MMIPVYIAHPTAETSGENIRWMPGQKAKFTGKTGKIAIVTIVTGERVRHISVPDDICIEVTFDDENNALFCVRAKQLNLTEDKVMAKLDGKFYGQIYKAKDDSQVPDDEYVVFLAPDTAFANVLPLYLEQCINLGADQEQIDAVMRMIGRVQEWRLANPDRVKVPDAAGERLLG